MALKPDLCVFIGEERIRRQRNQRSLQNVINLAGMNTALRFVAANTYDFEQTRSVLCELLEEYRDMRCIVDVSGGNDLLLLAIPKKIFCGRYPVFADLGILSDLSDISVIKDIRITSSEYAFRYASAQLGEYLRDVGIWLELYLYCMMVRSRLFDFVDINAVVSWDDISDAYDTTNEIDLIASSGIGRMFISCKTGVPDPSALNEIATLSRRFGGRYSIPVLATMCDLKSEAPAVFRRAVEMGIVVLDADDLNEEALYKKFRTLCQRRDQ